MTSFVFPDTRNDSGYDVRLDRRAVYASNGTPLLVVGDGPRTVLFAHGNSSTIGQHVDFAADLSRQFQCRTVLYEYPGYGGAAGQPSPDGLNAAALDAYQFARREFDGPVFGMSHSLGCGPTSSLGCSAPDIAGLAFFAPFSSTRRLGNDWVGWWSNMLDWPDWNVEANVAAVRSRTLFVHGELDELIPSYHSRRLFAAASNTEWSKLSIDPVGTHLYLTTDLLDEFFGVRKPAAFRYGIGQRLNIYA